MWVRLFNQDESLDAHVLPHSLLFRQNNADSCRLDTEIDSRIPSFRFSSFIMDAQQPKSVVPQKKQVVIVDVSEEMSEYEKQLQQFGKGMGN
jgi:hypothetical protein